MIARIRPVLLLQRHVGLAAGVAGIAGIACLMVWGALYLGSTVPDRMLGNAARVGDDAAVRALLRDGADPMWHNEKGQSAVGEAAMMGHTTTVLLLLDHGANPGDALWGAVWGRRPSVIREVFARRPDAASHWRFHIPLMDLPQMSDEPTARAVAWGLARARRQHQQAPAGPARAQP